MRCYFSCVLGIAQICNWWWDSSPRVLGGMWSISSLVLPGFHSDLLESHLWEKKTGVVGMTLNNLMVRLQSWDMVCHLTASDAITLKSTLSRIHNNSEGPIYGSKRTCVLGIALNNLIVTLQSWDFGECGVPLYCHYSQIHYYPEWYYLLGSHLWIK